jgi:diguanylate cyclase (GGDEF)-like protein
MAFPPPAGEPERLAALRALDILDTGSEPAYDDLVKLAAAICQTPIAMINLVDADRQWGKALFGLESSSSTREASFCARTILEPSAELVVVDTHADPAWAGNPFVTDDPHLRFYAGAAITTEDGHAVGAVCVADHVPRALDEGQLEALRMLARQTSSLLALRRRARDLADAGERLRELAVRDALTGLPNRALLLDRLALALARYRRDGRPLGVAFCDLDAFKPVNDLHGHHTGDELLRLVAGRLDAEARAGDTVGRLAGDEFVVVCPDVGNATELNAIGTRLSAAVALPGTVAGIELTPAISVGTALAQPDDDPEALLRRADDAMYAAKRRRRKNVSLSQ